MKRIYLISAILLLCFTSCQRSCNSFNRDIQVTNRSYEVFMYSGGKVVFHDKFKGIVNYPDKSDGAYYYKEDTLIEVSGDYIIKSVD